VEKNSGVVFPLNAGFLSPPSQLTDSTNKSVKIMPQSKNNEAERGLDVHSDAK
jgi:hypothetical protein